MNFKNNEHYEKLLKFLQMSEVEFWKESDYCYKTLDEIVDSFCVVKNKGVSSVIRNLIKTYIRSVSPYGQIFWIHTDKDVVLASIGPNKPTKEELIVSLGDDLSELIDLTNDRGMLFIIPPLLISCWKEVYDEYFPVTPEEVVAYVKSIRESYWNYYITGNTLNPVCS